MRITYLIFLLLAYIPAALCQSVANTVAIALQNSPAVSASREALHAAEAAEASTTRSFLPALSLSSSASVISERAEINLSKITGMPLGSVPLGAKENYSTSLNLSYLLFSGFAKKAAVRIGRDREQLSRTSLSRTEKETAWETADTYRSAQGLKLTITSLNAAIQRANMQLERIRALIRSGMALPVDSLSLVLGRLQYEQQRVTAEAALATAGQKLEMLTGRPIQVDDFSAEGAADPAGFNSKESEALRAVTIRQDIAAQRVTQARSVYFPQIAIQAAYNYGKPGIDPITNRWMTYGSAGLGLEWKLFQFGSARKQAEASEAAVRQLTHEAEQTKQQLRLRYDVQLRQYRSLQQALEIARKALAVAREKFRLVSLRAKEGMTSATAFNDANLELTQAEIAVQEQFITLARKRIELYFSSGTPLQTWKFD